MITYKELDYNLYFERIKEIYSLENWSIYLQDDEKLKNAFKNTKYFLGAFNEKDELLGFVRCVGDFEFVVFIQDLIIHKDFQRQGIGKNLMNKVFEKYKNARRFSLLTDINDEKANSFYKKINMQIIENGDMISYFK